MLLIYIVGYMFLSPRYPYTVVLDVAAENQVPYYLTYCHVSIDFCQATIIFILVEGALRVDPA